MVHVSSMTTSRLRSRHAEAVPTRRRPATSARPCSRANSVLLKLRPSRVRKVQPAWLRTACGEFVLQPVQVRCSICLTRSTMNARCGCKIDLRWSHISPGANRSGLQIKLCHFTTDEGTTQAPQRFGNSCQPASQQPLVHEDRSKEVGPLMLASDPSSILNHKPQLGGTSSKSIKQLRNVCIIGSAPSFFTGLRRTPS